MKTTIAPCRHDDRVHRSAAQIRRLAVALVVLVALGVPAGKAVASSDFATGTIDQANPVAGASQDLGVCRLYLGPRDEIQTGQFLLEIGDVENGSGAVEQLVGTATPDGSGGVTLSADDQAAEEFYQEVLRDQLMRPDAAFQLTGLEVEVFKTEFDRGPQAITCEMRLHGFLLGPSSRTLIPITPRTRLATIGIGSTSGLATAVYDGAGLLFPGIGDQGTVLTAAAAADPVAAPQAIDCPMPNYAPVPDQCNTDTCLVSFKGYQWWTEYEYWGPDGGYFYNANNAWSPKNVTVDGEGLHLFVQVQDVGAGPRYTAAEAVAALNPDGSLAQFGYGTYLVTATVKTASTWDAMDPNVAFGAFTYERDRTGTVANPAREIDLAELSRWGRVDGQQCENIPILCNGNAQFTLQQWDKLTANVHRYTISQPGPTVTLVMEWSAANTPVVFKQFPGALTLDDDLSHPANTWTSDGPTQNQFIPATHCEQFHLNLWMGNAPLAMDGYNPPPASPQEIVVSNFQFRPQGS
jgi:hypothetical protein